MIDTAGVSRGNVECMEVAKPGGCTHMPYVVRDSLDPENEVKVCGKTRACTPRLRLPSTPISSVRSMILTCA